MNYKTKKLLITLTVSLFVLGIGTLVYAQTTVNKDFNFTNSNSIYNLQGISIGTSTTNNNAITFSDGTVFDQGNASASWTSTSTGIIYNGGNVGIGVSSPNSKLDVNGAIYGTIFYDKDDTGYYVNPSGDSAFSGSVGIGITNPTEKVHIQGTGSELMIKADSVNNDNFGKIVFDEGDGGKHFQIIADGSSGSGSGRLRINSAGNGDVFTIERGGNVGIGTTNPGATLDVNGGIDVGGVLQIKGTQSACDGNQTGVIRYNGDFSGCDGSSWSSFTSGKWSASGSDIYYNSGNVGIGTTTPSRKLHIQGAEGNLAIGINNTQTSGWSGSELFLYNSGSLKSRVSYSPNGGVSAGTYVGSVSSDPLYLISNNSYGSPQVTVESGGNVGIAETNPVEKLHIEGNSGSGYPTLRLENTSGHTWNFWAIDGNDLRIRDVTDGADRLVIEGGSGNVGVGTINPSSKLHVDNGITRLTPTLSNQPQALRIIEDGASSDTYGVRMGNAGVGSISGDGRIDIMNNIYWRSSDGSGWRKWDSTNDYYGMYRIRNGKHSFWGDQTTTDSNLSLNLLMTITPSGDVGIGDSTPDSKLHVKGTVRASYFIDDNDTTYYVNPSHETYLEGSDNKTIQLGNSSAYNGSIYFEDASNWTGSPPSGQGKIEYHAGRFYINSGDTGNPTVIFRSGGSNESHIEGNGDLDMAGNDITNADKIDANTVDPVYNIGDSKYATYMAGMTGVKEETTGSVTLTKDNKDYTHTIDFQNLEKGSDLWVFYQTSDFGENWNNLSVLLTGDANVKSTAYYKLLPEEDKLVFYGEDSGSVSYRLTAPRFDHNEWSNDYKGDSKGLIVPEVK